MKKLLFILLTLFSLHSFAQDTIYVRPRGIPGVYNLSLNGGGDSIIFYVAGVRHALYIGATAGTGSVTSVAKGYGILQDGTITTTGTITVDSAALADKFKRITDSTDVSTLNGGKIDTSRLPISKLYIQQAGAGETHIVRAANDTTLSVATLKNSTDITISKNPDSSVVFNFTNPHYTKDQVDSIKATITADGIARAELIDTANNKVNISDTAAMLAPYLHKNTVSGGTINQVLKKNSSTDYDWSWQDGIDTTSLSNRIKDGFTPVLTTLTDGATITWNYLTDSREAKVTLAGNRTLSITNLPTGKVVYLTLGVTQDATGSRTLTLPAGTKVINGGSGAVTLTTTASATDILSFRWNGTTLFCTYGKNYN